MGEMGAPDMAVEAGTAYDVLGRSLLQDHPAGGAAALELRCLGIVTQSSPLSRSGSSDRRNMALLTMNGRFRQDS